MPKPDFITYTVEAIRDIEKEVFKIIAQFPPDQVIKAIDNLILAKQKETSPFLTPHEKAAFLKIQDTQLKILEGYKYQLEILKNQGTEGLSHFFKEMNVKEPLDAFLAYLQLTTPNYLVDGFLKDKILPSYVRNILSVYQKDLPSKQKASQAHAVTLRYFGGPLLIIEELRYTAYSQSTPPINTILNTCSSEDELNNFIKSTFDYGCKRDFYIISNASINNPDFFDIDKLKNHYYSLSQRFKQALDFTLSSNLDRPTAAAYLYTIQLRMDVIARYIDHYEPRNNIEGKGYQTNRIDKFKVVPIGYLTYRKLIASDYIVTYKNCIDKNAIQKALHEAQKIYSNKGFETIIATFPHTKLPEELFPDYIEIVDKIIHDLRLSLQQPAQGWALIERLVQQDASEIELIQALDQIIKNADLEPSTIVKIQDQLAKLPYQHKPTDKILETIKSTLKTAKNRQEYNYPYSQNTRIGGLTSHLPPSYPQSRVTFSPETPRFQTWEKVFKLTRQSFPFITQHPYTIVTTPGMATQANQKHGSYISFHKPLEFSFGQNQGASFIPFQPQQGAIVSPRRYNNPSTPIEMPVQEQPDTQKLHNGTFFAWALAPQTGKTIFQTMNQGGRVIQLPGASQQITYRLVAGAETTSNPSSSSFYRSPSSYNPAKQGKIVRLPSSSGIKPPISATYAIGSNIIAQIGLNYMVQQDPYIYQLSPKNHEIPYRVAYQDPLIETQNNFMMCVTGATVLTAQRIIMTNPHLSAGAAFIVGMTYKGATMLSTCIIAHPLAAGMIIVTGGALTATTLFQGERQNLRMTSADYKALQVLSLQRDYGDKAVLTFSTSGAKFRIYANNLNEEQKKIADAYNLPEMISINHIQSTRTDYDLQLLTIPNNRPQKVPTFVVGYWEKNKFKALKEPISTNYQDLRFHGAVKKDNLKMQIDDKTRYVLGITK